jgi:hypothetical protein
VDGQSPAAPGSTGQCLQHKPGFFLGIVRILLSHDANQHRTKTLAHDLHGGCRGCGRGESVVGRQLTQRRRFGSARYRGDVAGLEHRPVSGTAVRAEMFLRTGVWLRPAMRSPIPARTPIPARRPAPSVARSRPGGKDPGCPSPGEPSPAARHPRDTAAARPAAATARGRSPGRQSRTAGDVGRRRRRTPAQPHPPTRDRARFDADTRRPRANTAARAAHPHDAHAPRHPTAGRPPATTGWSGKPGVILAPSCPPGPI